MSDLVRRRNVTVKKGIETMKNALKWTAVLSGSFLSAAVGTTAPPTRVPITPASASAAAPSPANLDQEYERLVKRMSALSDTIGRNPQDPQVYRWSLDQGETLLRLALRSKGDERENWLRMAVDCYHSAAVQSPVKQQNAYQLLAQLPAWIVQNVPGSPVASYAVYQEIQADFLRRLGESGDTSGKAQAHLCQRLVQFAQESPAVPEAPKALMEAGHTYEQMGKTDQARQCYRYVTEKYAGKPAGRNAGGALWRMGLDGEQVDLRLPSLYSAPGDGEVFDLIPMRGRLVVLHFWSASDPRAETNFETLKQLAYRSKRFSFSLVHVNMDADPAAAREFLKGKLTSGIHLHQSGGLSGPVAERYGIEKVPEIFLLGPDGKLVKHSLTASKVEAEIEAHLAKK